MRVPRNLPSALLITLAIFGATLLPKTLPGLSIFARALLGYAVMAGLSGLAMVLTTPERWKEFGFQRARGAWGRLALVAVLLGASGSLALKACGGKGVGEKLQGLHPALLLLLVLTGSLVEELFTRGWLQGFLEPLREQRVHLGIPVSVPVLTGALVFGAMHLGSLWIDPWTGAFVLGFTTGLGLLAGMARERTGSLLPAIGIHLAGNAGGIAGGLIYLGLRRAMGLQA